MTDDEQWGEGIRGMSLANVRGSMQQTSRGAGSPLEGHMRGGSRVENAPSPRWIPPE